MIEWQGAGCLRQNYGRLDRIEDRLSGTQEAVGSNPSVHFAFHVHFTISLVVAPAST